MTTHVLIVDKNTFKKHLEYMFIGTGNGKPFLFNNDKTSYPFIHPSTENSQALIVADCNRMREGDKVIFYLVQSDNVGGFFGVFKVKKAPTGNFVSFTDYKDDKYPGLTKELEYRALIEPDKVYAEGVSEWEALDDIRAISSPCQMLWSLIYRKLKGNRGNTMITIYETERLINLIQAKNAGKTLTSASGGYSFDEKTNRIIQHAPSIYDFSNCVQIDISKRLIQKYQRGQAHEAHLQAFITNNIGKGTCPSLENSIINQGERIEWIGNEVSCGVGMQRMDILLSTRTDGEVIPNLYVVELKCVPIEKGHILQINRYIDWLTQYYTPNRPSKIIPVLITRDDSGSYPISAQIMNEKNNFDAQYLGQINYSPLKLIRYQVKTNRLIFF